MYRRFNLFYYHLYLNNYAISICVLNADILIILPMVFEFWKKCFLVALDWKQEVEPNRNRNRNANRFEPVEFPLNRNRNWTNIFERGALCIETVLYCTFKLMRRTVFFRIWIFFNINLFNKKIQHSVCRKPTHFTNNSGRFVC